MARRAWWPQPRMLIRRFQSGYIYHYAFTMIVGVFVLMSVWLFV